MITLIFLKGLCEYVLANILTLSSPRVYHKVRKQHAYLISQTERAPVYSQRCARLYVLMYSDGLLWIHMLGLHKPPAHKRNIIVVSQFCQVFSALKVPNF